MMRSDSSRALSTTPTSLTPPLRLRILSDLHLDHAPWTFTPAREDLVVLAGDLCDHSRTGLRRRDRLFAEIANVGLSAVYVLGNHEAYEARCPHQQVVEEIRASLPDHIRWLGPGVTIDIQGVRFVGCTLWTDFTCTLGLLHNGTTLDQETACRIAEAEINDFHCIQAVAGRAGCSTQDLIGWHRTERAWLEQAIRTSDRPVIVVSHFLPSPLSVAPQFCYDCTIPYFVGDCRSLIRSPVIAWIHGHTHTSCHYRHRGVEVVCNPRGYGNENPASSTDLVVVVGATSLDESTLFPVTDPNQETVVPIRLPKHGRALLMIFAEASSPLRAEDALLGLHKKVALRSLSTGLRLVNRLMKDGLIAYADLTMASAEAALANTKRIADSLDDLDGPDIPSVTRYQVTDLGRAYLRRCRR